MPVLLNVVAADQVTALVVCNGERRENVTELAKDVANDQLISLLPGLLFLLSQDPVDKRMIL